MVVITKMEVKEVPRQSSGASAVSSSPYAQQEMDAVQTLITPKAYSEANLTPLKATVVKGKNALPFNMESGQ
jgi:hypothetical protein